MTDIIGFGIMAATSVAARLVSGAVTEKGYYMGWVLSAALVPLFGVVGSLRIPVGTSVKPTPTLL